MGVAAVFLLLSACASQQDTPVVSDHTHQESVTAGQTEKLEADLKKAEMDRIRQKITAAVEKARREGKTSVDVYLDERAGDQPDAIQSDVVQQGDLVQISYQASLENGTMVTGEKDQIKTLTAGPGSVLARETLGMKLNQLKKAVIEPKEAFGLHKDESMQAFPAKKNPAGIPADQCGRVSKTVSAPASGK